MTMTAGNILAVNAGSSSIKLAVFGPDMTCRFTLSISGIGLPASTIQLAEPYKPPQTLEVHVPSHTAGSAMLIKQLGQLVPAESVVAVGHRVVHGGDKYTRPTLAEKIHSDDWDVLAKLDPQHIPAARLLIRAFRQHYPDAPQVACFDTAFFDDLPDVAKVVAVPKKYRDLGVRRYGFHGLSYTSLLRTFQEQAGETAARGRVILAHLGNGASVTAVKDGKPVDTTMGFTPTSGIVMSTRSGDLDPTIFSFLHRQHHMSADAFDQMVNFESGLLGASGLTGDMKTLLAKEKDHTGAATAVELFVRDVKKTVGGFAALLGGVDSVIFSGGVGEQSATIRSRICQGLEHLGIMLDEPANAEHAFLISSDQSSVGVHVIASDEAKVIATQTHKMINNHKEPHE